MDDPYDIDLPDGWTCAVDDSAVVYEDADVGVRVAVEEFAKQLTLYWWVDVYVREAGDWEHRELGMGDSYRDPAVVAGDVQTLVDSLDAASAGETSLDAALSGAAADGGAPGDAPPDVD